MAKKKARKTVAGRPRASGARAKQAAKGRAAARKLERRLFERLGEIARVHETLVQERLLGPDELAARVKLEVAKIVPALTDDIVGLYPGLFVFCAPRPRPRPR